jgi:UDP-glucose 4-epimerase
MLEPLQRRLATVGVVGASSPLGRRLVEMLLDEGCRVRCVVRTPKRIPSAWLNHPRCEVDTAIGPVRDLVWLAHIRRADRRDEIRANARLMETALAEPRRVVFVSSGGAVYGEPDAIPVDESHPRRPLSAYGAAKCVLEDLVAAAAEREGTGVILRPGNIYGAEYVDGGAGAIAAFARALTAGQPITLRDGGRGARDFVHVDDVARAIVSALSWRGRLAIWNVGTGVPTPTAEVLDQVCAILGQLPSAVIDQPRADGDVSAICLSPQRIAADCGWRPVYSLATGLAAMFDKLHAGDLVPAGSR